MPFTLFQLTWNTFLKTHSTSENCILHLKTFPYIVPEKGKFRTYMMDTIIYKNIYIVYSPPPTLLPPPSAWTRQHQELVRGAGSKSKGRQRLNTSTVAFKPRTSITIAVIKQVKMQSSWVLSQANKNHSKTQAWKPTLKKCCPTDCFMHIQGNG